MTPSPQPPNHAPVPSPPAPTMPEVPPAKPGEGRDDDASPSPPVPG